MLTEPPPAQVKYINRTVGEYKYDRVLKVENNELIFVLLGIVLYELHCNSVKRLEDSEPRISKAVKENCHSLFHDTIQYMK